MKLFYTAGSPYARKVRVVLREKGLLQYTSEVLVNPHENPDELLQLNPLAKVPTFVGKHGPLMDSPVICEYLDGLVGQASLIPSTFEERMAVLRLQALADGIMDAAVATVLELRRHDARPSEHWIKRWEAAIQRGVALLAKECASSDLNVGVIAAVCALDYLSFRMPQLDWQTQYPGLARWAGDYLNRTSFIETAPPRAA